jgi:Glyoxalase-like domain
VMRIDHVLLATSDLDAAASRLEAEHGLVATGGGRHDGLGTHNRIVPLGGGYLELIAVADADEAASSEFGRALSARIGARGEGLMGWAVAVDDVEVVAARLGTRIDTIARQGLTARLTGTAEAMAEPALPFFIERDAGVADPGAEGDAGGITWIEVASDERALHEWLGVGAGLPVRVVDGPGGVVAVGIGSRVLR